MMRLRSEQSGDLARIFAPFCAIFVPWSFLKRLATGRGILLTSWEIKGFLGKGCKWFDTHEKARQRRAISLILL
jgi:hypothetical protein